MNNLLKVSFLSSIFSLATSSCQKLPFREIPTQKVAPVIANRVDSFIAESEKVMETGLYQAFKCDTVKVTKDFFSNPQRFFLKLDKKAISETPRTVVRTYTVMVPSVVHKWRVVEPQIRHEYSKNFIEQKCIMVSDKIFTRDSVDMYIPVEYVGIENPKLKQNK